MKDETDETCPDCSGHGYALGCPSCDLAQDPGDQVQVMASDPQHAERMRAQTEALPELERERDQWRAIAARCLGWFEAAPPSTSVHGLRADEMAALLRLALDAALTRSRPGRS